MKHRLVHVLQRRVLNPPIKLFLSLGLVPPSYALLETRGRTSGKPRRTPVGNGLVGDTFWLVAEHGGRASYVRNMRADPRVRVKLREGLRTTWRRGTAHLLPDDDPRARQRELASGRPGRALNAFVVRTLGTDLLVVRIDLDRATAANR